MEREDDDLGDDLFSADLAALHYPEGWHTSGFIDAAFVRRQREEFERGGDTNREHYRYRAFSRILAERDVLSDDEMTRFIGIAVADGDRTMATAALIRRVVWCNRNDRQFKHLSSHPAFAAPVVQKRIAREREKRRV